MAQEIRVSSFGFDELVNRLHTSLVRTRPAVIGMASAFVSVRGIERIVKLLRQCGSPDCRLIAGISNHISHPEALNLARRTGWQLRLGCSTSGIFHPKLIVAGGNFLNNGTIEKVSFAYVGSANLTESGLTRNTECGFLAEGDASFDGASDSFARLWNASSPADNATLKNYASLFAELSRRRSSKDLEALGVSDETAFMHASISQVLAKKSPKRAAFASDFAEAAWTGLQSFTGDYAFQIEFPRSAGEVVGRLVALKATPRGRVDVFCTNDHQTRNMQFRYYSDNCMFRLNVPNDVPNVNWVRQHKDGLALVERGPAGGAPIRLTIHLPGGEASEIIGRSVALDAWGKIQTRLYGWF